ncbi:double-strand break repair helicase AddA [Beijerinckia indica]|uniref:DNA 3'-5' helicase n=1 Tax=Beijerinckia indica subsp. indica (strain ATCC 9039 / DSM 1715 / NCIMB 8712) TaxID=395963 RepID=B2IGN4_BEII9|nr:double-strand break repair helicase AddA [Beijerinckia indica]ACB95795.1 double-strand break repair helicase AddA [Beijerinckia indica subsp. indica ATCC 9039]
MRQIPITTLERQKKASDPATSIWVSAHAGSGKTHVLAQRVIRILLRGVPPAKILCLTFTKAAAANMAARVFDRLALWTRLDDATLRQEIIATGAPAPEAADLLLARKLFARTVETPGGLKIQTLHAFCEKLLHLFPFEANVPSRFSVVEEERQKELFEQARHTILHEAEGKDHPLRGALALLTESCSSDRFENLIKEAMARGALGPLATGHHAEIGLRKALDLVPGETIETIQRAMIEDGIAPSLWPDIAAFLLTGSATDQKRAAALQKAYEAYGSAATGGGRVQEGAQGACLAHYLGIFFTAKEEKAKQLLTKKLAEQRPDLDDLLYAEQDRLDRLADKQKAAAILARTLALLSLTEAIFERYEASKAHQGFLDFNDLIERTKALLFRSDARWVLYKLDAGIDHILVDEAQDTSEAQWKILEEMTGDFASGLSSRVDTRTFFAVGDEKQSIFSFQGAAPHMFDQMRRRFNARFDAGEKAFNHVRLTDSFRSVPGILETVDQIFDHAGHYQGLVAANDPWMPHTALKAQLPGLVELWPLVGPSETEDIRDWTLPLDFPDEHDPPNIVAWRVAQKIAHLLTDRAHEHVYDEKQGLRPIRAGDILILVRSRGPFFAAIIRALKQLQIPVAGADRLAILQHIAVMDLIAAGRAALLPQDDLTLACVLKSPLIGLTDEDLIALAPGRPASLFDALRQSEDPRHAAAAARLDLWHQRIGLPPFTFYAQLLGTDGGRRDLEARLGPEAADAIDEFLNLTLQHERDSTPSLVAFLAELDNRDPSVRRDMETGADLVRVMTVHAAKGLEAKIVFLPDTCAKASGSHDPLVFSLGTDAHDAQILAWSSGKTKDCAALAKAREISRQGEEDEHRRLLYVALTRAEERLYITGFHGKKGPGNGSWHEMIDAALLGSAMEEIPAFWDPAENVRRRLSPGSLSPDDTHSREEEAKTDNKHLLPSWLVEAPPPEAEARPPLRPSSALAAADGLDEDFMPTAATPANLAALQRGRLIHLLLQYLPSITPSHRQQAAMGFLGIKARYLDGKTHALLTAEALTIIEDPKLRGLYLPRSLAEVAVAGTISLGAGRTLSVNGRIDRIGETDEAVLLADYKTGAMPRNGRTPETYLTQMALYRAVLTPLWPDKPIRVLLIWTASASIQELPASALDAALADLQG